MDNIEEEQELTEELSKLTEDELYDKFELHHITKKSTIAVTTAYLFWFQTWASYSVLGFTGDKAILGIASGLLSLWGVSKAHDNYNISLNERNLERKYVDELVKRYDKK